MLNINYFLKIACFATFALSSKNVNSSSLSINSNSLNQTEIHLEAENRNDNSIGLSSWTTGVGNIGGNWIKFNSVDFNTGFLKITTRLASAISRELLFSIDSLNGQQLGVLNYTSTGGWESYENLSLYIDLVTGVHDLFIFGTAGTANIDWFKILEPNLNYAPSFSSITSDTLFEAEDRDDNSGGISAWNTGIGNIGGNWIKFNNINFGNGFEKLTTRLATTIIGELNFVVDSLNGETIGTLNYTNTGGWEEFEEVTIDISLIQGNRKLYVVGNSGTANIDWFKLSQPVNINAPSNQMQDTLIEAENRNSNSIGISAWNTGIGNIGGNWIKFNDINFAGTYNEIVTNLATLIDGELLFILDSLNGAVIGTLNYSSTGGWGTHEQISTPITVVNGIHDLYVLGTTGTANIDWFSLRQSNLNPLSPNQQPYFSPINDQTVTINHINNITIPIENISPSEIDQTIIDIQLTFLDNYSILDQDNTFVSFNSTNTASINLALNSKIGEAQVTVTIQDDGGVENGGIDTFSRSFNVTILPENNVPNNERNFYVSVNGSDNNDGRTLQTAFRNINTATELVNPGDTIFIDNGTYEESVAINISGDPNNYIVLKSIEKWGAKLISNSGIPGLNIKANYIEVNGIDITNPSGHCINAEQNHHVRIMNCHAHYCGHSGITAGFSDFYHIEGNVTHHNASLAWYSGISIYQARDIGDDSPGFHNIIRNNISYSNIQEDGYRSDGNGIIIDDFNQTQSISALSQEYNPPYPYETLIENNLCFDNGSAGIKVVWSDNVTVRNNTLFRNQMDNGNIGDFKGELYSQDSRNGKWINNIVWCDPTVNPYITAILDRGSSSSDNNLPNIWANNLLFNGTVNSTTNNIKNVDNDSDRIFFDNIIGINPQFNNPSIDFTDADFRIKINSPAINAGTNSFGLAEFDLENNPRIHDEFVDIGAYEFYEPTVFFPRVSITFPTPEIFFDQASDIEIHVDASIQNSVIDSIQLFLNNQRHGTIYNENRVYNIGNLSKGKYTVYVQAFAQNGSSVVSNQINLTVNICGTASADFILEAEDRNDNSIGISAWNSGVGNIGGEWIKFENIDFGNGYASIIANLATTINGTLSIFIDDLNGQLAGQINYENTGSWNDFLDFQADLDTIKGLRDIYIVGTDGSANLDKFLITCSADNPDNNFSQKSGIVQQNNHDDLKIFIYPNPSKEYISIINVADNTKFDIFDLNGKQVVSGLITSSMNKIDISQLREGMYIIQFDAKDKYYANQKFIKSN